MGKSNSTSIPAKQRRMPTPESLAAAIELQRTRLIEVSAMVSCLGCFLADVPAASRLPDLQPMTDVIERMLLGSLEALDPIRLGLPDPEPEPDES